jgi:hypothetical protein
LTIVRAILACLIIGPMCVPFRRLSVTYAPKSGFSTKQCQQAPSWKVVSLPRWLHRAKAYSLMTSRGNVSKVKRYECQRCPTVCKRRKRIHGIKRLISFGTSILLQAV